MKCKICDPIKGGLGANTLREDVQYCDKCGNQIDSTTGYPINAEKTEKTENLEEQ